MPLDFQWENRGFYVKLSGDVTSSDIEFKNFHFSSDDRCDNCRYQIIDGSEIDTFAVQNGGIEKLASNDIGMSYYLPELMMFIVGTNPDLRDAMKQYISLCLQANTTWKFLICDTLEQARKWHKQIETDRNIERNSKLSLKWANWTQR